MKDQFGREINYLRISLTDRCNLRCRYCMPEEGACLKTHDDMLTEDELIMAVEAAASLGVNKVRITGGEPLLKKNIVAICARISKISGIDELCLTTNGLLLPKMRKALVAAGVSRVNVSINTLKKEKYEYITRREAPEDLLVGLKAALDAGFKQVKVNAVLIGGFNDDEIKDLADLSTMFPVDVRFIELMPMYDSGDFDNASFLSSDYVIKELDLKPASNDTGVASKYTFANGQGSIGLISALSHSFCSECNRIRLTADGFIKPCLHSKEEISIKGMKYLEMKKTLEKAIFKKPACHPELSYSQRSASNRNMNRIGG